MSRYPMAKQIMDLSINRLESQYSNNWNGPVVRRYGILIDESQLATADVCYLKSLPQPQTYHLNMKVAVRYGSISRLTHNFD
jgi:hypothetical protein